MLVGRGVTGRVDGHDVSLGNAKLMQDERVDIAAAEAFASQARSKGATAMHLAIDGRLAACVSLADAVKASTKPALDALHAAGVRLIMATGDNEATAKAVARDLPIDDVHAGVSRKTRLALSAH